MNGLFTAIFLLKSLFFSEVASVFFLIVITIYQLKSTKTPLATPPRCGLWRSSSQLNTHLSSSPIASLTSATINVNITSEMRTVRDSERELAEHIN